MLLYRSKCNGFSVDSASQILHMERKVAFLKDDVSWWLKALLRTPPFRHGSTQRNPNPHQVGLVKQRVPEHLESSSWVPSLSVASFILHYRY